MVPRSTTRLLIMLDSSGDEKSNKLTVNRKFAETFINKERKKELRRSKETLKELQNEETESDSETEDDEAELLTTKLNVDIINTIKSLREKDPKIYDLKTNWFENEDILSDEDTELTKVKLDQKLKFKDVLRNQLLTHGANMDDEETLTDKKSNKLMYDKEQEKLRKQIINAGKPLTVSNDEDDDDSDDLLQPLVKSSKEMHEEEIELQHALQELKNLDKSEEESFLTEFISNKRWKTPTTNQEHATDKKVPRQSDQFEDEEKDEEEVEEMERFESRYNFRFEEMEDQKENVGMQVTGHARNIGGSVRRVDEKRKVQREAVLERKEKEKRKKEAELRRLKNLKREELTQRLRKIAKVGGLKQLGLIDEAILDEEWDPKKHEALMNEEFGETYYNIEEDNETIRNFLSNVDGDGNDMLGDTALRIDGGDEGDENYDYDAQVELNHQMFGDNILNTEEDLVVDDDEIVKKKRSDKTKKNKKNKNIEQKSNLNYENDADENSGNGEKNDIIASKVEELMYSLDYEDIVAGIQCRFKYNQVEPQDFGLTVEDILVADDTELNRFVSLKHITSGARVNKKQDAATISCYNSKLNPLNERMISKKRKRLRANVKERLMALEEPSKKKIDNNEDQERKIKTSSSSIDISVPISKNNVEKNGIDENIVERIENKTDDYKPEQTDESKKKKRKRKKKNV